MSITIERFERFPCRAEIAPRKKRAWIDPEQKLVSFHESARRNASGSASCDSSRRATVSSSAFRLAPPEKTW